MVVETSSASTITKRGNPWIFRISPPSEMEALGLQKYLKDFGIKRADFLAVNTDWGRGAVGAFGDILKKSGVAVGTARAARKDLIVPILSDGTLDRTFGDRGRVVLRADHVFVCGGAIQTGHVKASPPPPIMTYLPLGVKMRLHSDNEWFGTLSRITSYRCPPLVKSSLV